MKSKKIVIIVIIIITVLAVAGATFGYLFLATDMFKSNKELFAKYMNQNLETLKKISELNVQNVYKGLKNEGKYESNTDIKILYSEGGEVSNPFNNLTAKIVMQKDNETDYFYADGQILFANDEYLESELIKDQGLYGIRFTDVAKQFITVKKDDNLESIANEIGIDVMQLNTIIDIMNGDKEVSEASEEIISEEKIITLKEKYFNMVFETIQQGTFENQKKTMITYNNDTIKTNAYMVTLNSAQVEEIFVKILNALKEDLMELNQNINLEQIDNIVTKITEEEMPEIKISLYEQNQKLLRTLVEIGTNKITIENVEDNEGQKSNIKLQLEQNDIITEYEINISKKNEGNQEIFEIVFKDINENGNYTIGFLNKMQKDENNITLNSSLTYKKDIITAEILLENIVDIGNQFEKKIVLDEKNNVVLNNLTEENRKNIIETLKASVPEKVNVRLNLLSKALLPNNDETETQQQGEMSQVDINKFNAKFEFYVGEAVSADNVKVLLGIAKENLGSVEITQVENTENPINNTEDVKYSIKLNIEKEKINEEDANKVLEKIDDKKKYKVSISYNETNGLIKSITIDETES